MKRLPYDSDLHMFVEGEQPTNLNLLAFLKYLVETGRLADDTQPRRPAEPDLCVEGAG